VKKHPYDGEEYEKVLELLYKSGANINTYQKGYPLIDSKTPLHHAVEYHNHWRMDWLLKRGASEWIVVVVIVVWWW